MGVGSYVSTLFVVRRLLRFVRLVCFLLLYALTKFPSLNVSRRLVAIFAATAVGIEAALFTDYDFPNPHQKEHVLTGTQTKARNLWNYYIYGVPLPDQQQTHKRNDKQ